MQHTKLTAEQWLNLKNGQLCISIPARNGQSSIIPLAGVISVLDCVVEEGGKGKEVAEKMLETLHAAVAAFGKATLEVPQPEGVKVAPAPQNAV